MVQSSQDRNGGNGASWHCQTNLNGPAKGADLKRSGCKLTPFRECGSAVLLEDFAAVQVAVLVEVIGIEAWAAANFWRVFMSLNFPIARSRRRNGWWEFSGFRFSVHTGCASAPRSHVRAT